MIPLQEKYAGQKREDQLMDYLSTLDEELRYDYDARLNGDGVYVGYKTLRDFYKGKQWSYKPGENATMRSYNYCNVVVENMTAFLASEPPESTHEPRDVTDEVQVVVSEQITKFLKLVHDQNRLAIEFQKGARVGSLTGDTFILGPFWNPVDKVITYRVAERPELVRPIWATDDFSELDGFILRYRMNPKRAERMWARQMKERGIESLVPDQTGYAGANTPTSDDAPKTEQSMVTVTEYYDDSENVIIINGKVIDYVKHDNGFIPCEYIPNVHLPGESRGTSDLENILDAQQEYNIGNSAVKDILDAVGYPLLWGNELENLSEVQTGRGVIYNMPEKSTLNAIQVSGNPSVVENYSDKRKGDITAIAKLNEVVISGAGNVSQMSGRAMSVLMQGINNSVSLRKPFWQAALERLNENILILAEKHVPGAKELIRGNYNTTVFISSAYMRSITDELNKLTHKIQSLKTTMKNVGIPSPTEELKVMKTELDDETLNIELSRQPGLKRTWEKEDRAEQQAQAQQQQIDQELPADAANGPSNGGQVLTEDQNQGGELPQATPGQRVATPGGAVNQETQQQTGAPVMLEGEEL